MKTPSGDGAESTKKHKPGDSSSSSACLAPYPGSHMDAAAPIPTAPADQINPPAADVPQPTFVARAPLSGRKRAYELFISVSPSVVTVTLVSVAGLEEDKRGTGFIISATVNYALVFTSLSSAQYGVNDYHHFVYLEGSSQGARAYILSRDPEEKFIILIVQTHKMHATVTLSDIPLQYEPVITVGAAFIRTTHVRSDTPIDESFLGSLEMHQGRVLTPNCSALTLHYEPLEGSDNFFEVKCLAQDSIMQFEYIDVKKHTSSRIESAPVFAMTGKVVGLIHSAGTDVEVKNGFLSKSIISSLITMCGGAIDWEAGLKIMGDLKYDNTFGNEE